MGHEINRLGQPLCGFLRKHLTTPLLINAALMTLMTIKPSFAQPLTGVNTFPDKIVATIPCPVGISNSALAVTAVGFSFNPLELRAVK
jgi:hypothetical protein